MLWLGRVGRTSFIGCNKHTFSTEKKKTQCIHIGEIDTSNTHMNNQLRNNDYDENGWAKWNVYSILKKI